jgi:glycosyltransferase EpsD
MLAIKAFEELGNESHAQLVMAGSGELFDECKKYAEKGNLSVQFLGWISEVNTLLSASDILLMSSKNEGMPMVIVEAALKGVPTLSTNVGGVGEFINSGKNGWLCQQGESQITFNLRNILQLKNLAPQSLGARMLAIQEYSIHSMKLKYTELYREN